MTEQEGVVVALDGDFALVDLSAAEGCGSCSRAGGCGAGDGGGRRQRIPNMAGARVGDQVVIAVPDGAVLKAALRAYILPLACALAGVASGLSFSGEVAGTILGLGGLAVGWAWLRRPGTAGAARDIAPIMRIKPSVIHLHRNHAS